MPTKKQPIKPLDKLDMAILSMLAQDAEVPIKTMAKQNHVSPSSIYGRMKILADRGIIEGTRTKVNLAAVGYEVIAFVGIQLKKGSFHELVIDRLRKIPEVSRAHTLTGRYSILVEVLCTNTDHFRLILAGYIQVIPGVDKTETMFSLQEDFAKATYLSHMAVGG